MQFLLEGGSTAGANAQLHKMDLIAGEQPIGQPQCDRSAVEPPGRDVVGAGGGRGQPDCADDLRRHPSLASKLFTPA